MSLFESLGLASRPDYQFQSSLDPDQQPVSTEMGRSILEGLQRGTYAGDVNYGLDPGLASTQQWLQSQAQNFGQFDTATANAIRRNLSGQVPGSEVDTVSAWRKGIYEPGIKALQQDAIPLLKDTFAQQGAGYSSRLLDAGRRMTSDFTTGATSALANMIREDQIRREGREDAAANRAVSTIPLATGAGQARFGEASALTQALLPYQNYGQNNLDRLRAAFNQINPYLGASQGYLGLNNQIVYDASPQLNVEGQFATDLMGAGTNLTAALGAAAIAASDKNLKSNIKYLTSKLPVNLATWTWNNKAKTLGLEGRGFGVIAQDVQRVWPELVNQDKRGFLRVFIHKVFDKLVGGTI